MRNNDDSNSVPSPTIGMIRDVYAMADKSGKMLLEGLYPGAFIDKSIITNRVKTYNDAVLELGIKTNTFLRNYSTQVEYFSMLRVVMDALNEGWKIKDGDMVYHPCFSYNPFRLNNIYGFTNVEIVGCPVYYKSNKLAEYAGKQFIDLYKGFFGFTADEGEKK